MAQWGVLTLSAGILEVVPDVRSRDEIGKAGFSTLYDYFTVRCPPRCIACAASASVACALPVGLADERLSLCFLVHDCRRRSADLTPASSRRRAAT